jgi:hypothetical protein
VLVLTFNIRKFHDTCDLTAATTMLHGHALISSMANATSTSQLLMMRPRAPVSPTDIGLMETVTTTQCRLSAYPDNFIASAAATATGPPLSPDQLAQLSTDFMGMTVTAITTPTTAVVSVSMASVTCGLVIHHVHCESEGWH